MKKYILALATLAFAATSCVKDEVYEGEVDETDYSVLVMNEIEGTGNDADKYIELYNTSATETIPLLNVRLLYQGGETWTGTASQNIAPGAYFVVKGTKSGDYPGEGHMMSTGLSSTQAITVELKDPSNSRIDLFAKEATTGKKNIARIPDGTGPWHYNDVVEAGQTEGNTNGTSTTGKTPVDPS